MTRRNSARAAGAAFLLYIVFALTDMFVTRSATEGADTAARLANIAAHANNMRASILLTIASGLCAFTLACTLYRLTRDADQDMAALGLAGRSVEGALNAIAAIGAALLLWLGTTGATAMDASPRVAIAATIFKFGSTNTSLGSWCVSLGSTGFAVALLRGRIIPRWLAWVGVVGSVMLVIGLPLRLVGWLPSGIASAMWAPVAVFELTVAPWFIIKGAREPANLQA
jgi:hypothetical protein